jgi:predicted RecB family nuclease
VLKRHIHGDYSTELRQVDHILGVLLLIKKDTEWSFILWVNKSSQAKTNDERGGVVEWKYRDSTSYDGIVASNTTFL